MQCQIARLALGKQPARRRPSAHAVKKSPLGSHLILVLQPLLPELKGNAGWAAAPELCNIRRSLCCATFITDLAQRQLQGEGGGQCEGGEFWSPLQDVCHRMTKCCEYMCSCVSPTVEHLPCFSSGRSGAEQLARRCRWYLYDPSSCQEQAGVSAAGMGRVGIGAVTGGGMGEEGRGGAQPGEQLSTLRSCAIRGFFFASGCSRADKQPQETSDIPV